MLLSATRINNNNNEKGDKSKVISCLKKKGRKFVHETLVAVATTDRKHLINRNMSDCIKYIAFEIAGCWISSSQAKAETDFNLCRNLFQMPAGT